MSIIAGYGVGINWKNKEVFKRLVDQYGKINNQEKIELDEFLDDPYANIELIVTNINKEIKEKYKNKGYGLDYETAHDEYLFMLFHDVRHGEKCDLSTEEVDQIIEDLSKNIYDIHDVESRNTNLYQEITRQDGIYGEIEEVYFA